ncbi:MAG: MliC family protein [Gluconobacter sp.]
MAVLCLGVNPAFASKATNLQIKLASATTVDRHTVLYTCQGNGDAAAELLSRLPKKRIAVQYINADAISLAVLPIEGQTQVFSNVIAADGAKYAAAQYVWWNKGNDAFFSSDMDDKALVTCHAIGK